jgi:hypothetical protein
MTFFVAVDIGCIECGEETNVLGVFINRQKAQSVLNKHKKRQNNNWVGQHSFELFELDEIDKEYKVFYRRD